MEIAEVKTFFRQFANTEIEHIEMLPQSGSSRKNFVAKANGDKYIITTNPNVQENESFFYFSDVFTSLYLNTPKILKISEDRQMYIQEFLGEKTLSQIIENEGINEKTTRLIKKTLQKLFEFQHKTQGKIDYSQTFEYEKYDRIPIQHDLFYFKFLFVDILELPYHKSTLIKEFELLTDIIQNLAPRGLMIRDFQSRNIIVNDDEVYFIDYQSAMYGNLMYDVISFLYQAKANFPEDFRREMLDFYIHLFDDEQVREELRASILPIRMVRNLQVLGAYGYRGLVQKKEHFIKSIAQGIENLKQTAQDWQNIEAFPELRSIIDRLNMDNVKINS